MAQGFDTAPAFERRAGRSTRPVRMTMCAALMVAANIVGAILVERTAGAATNVPRGSGTSLVVQPMLHYGDVFIRPH